jgi:hypothetical protein
MRVCTLPLVVLSATCAIFGAATMLRHGPSQLGDAPPVPTFDEQFACNSTEFADQYAAAGEGNSTSQETLLQIFAWDLYNRKSRMQGFGAPVGGYLDQLTIGQGPNGTISPATLYQISNATANGTLECQYQDLDMEWSPFWDLPANGVYFGRVEPPSPWTEPSLGGDGPALYDSWIFPSNANQVHVWQLFAVKHADGSWAPKYYGALPAGGVGSGYHWRYDGYVAGPPPESTFAAPTDCSNVTALERVPLLASQTYV